jgi:hypothetical protein
VRTGDGTEHEDQPDQRAGGRRRILEQLEADVVGRQARRHDARADHRHDQEPGAQRLGCEAAGQVQAQRAGAGLDLDRELRVAGAQRVLDHEATRR